MRTVNSDALAEINQEYGLEPITIIRVWWNDTPVDYSDKEEDSENTLGRILEVGGLNNVVSIDRSSASTSVSVKLDDSDGSLRSIINNQDVHKRPAQVLQWFAGRPKSEAFVLFTGTINTPMEWSEGERTFTFTIINEIENLELGFSLEEGIFQSIPVTAYGKSFPLVFGAAVKVPALMLSESPSGITAQGFAWVFGDAYEEESKNLSSQIDKIFQLAQLAYQQSIGAAFLAPGYNDAAGSVDPDPPDDYGTYTSLKQASNQLYGQYVSYMDQYHNMQRQLASIQSDKDTKSAFAVRQVVIASENFPRGTPVIVEINGTRFFASFDGIVMNIAGIIDPPDNPPQKSFFTGTQESDTAKITTTTKSKEKFRWFDAGSKIRVISVPLYYVACLGSGNVIGAVYARQHGVRVPIPTNLYRVEYVPFTNDFGVTVFATVIVVLQPLTTLYDLEANPLYESDDIWVDIVSVVPGNLISILNWTIANFTSLTADAESFAAVAAQTINNPMNFAVLERKNTLDFIKEICYQARTSIWVDDNVVKLRYLPATPEATVTITPDDVLEGSLSITTDDTENLVTKTTALWRPEYDLEQPNKYIIRYNIDKYGLLEEQVDFYAFQTGELVRRAVAFWAIRKGNTWKQIRLKTHVGKLQLESQDAVLLSGFNNMFANGDVTGIVETATFDSSEMSIELVIWLPIRWGEMDPYIFAYPANVSDVFGFNLPEFFTGNPYSQVQDTTGLLDQVKSGFMSVGPLPPISSKSAPINDSPPSVSVTTALSNVPIVFGRPAGFANANDRNDYEVKTLPDVTIDTTSKDHDFGTIQSYNPDKGTYLVQLQGEDKTVTAKQKLIADGFKIPVGTPVYVVKKKGTWWMQSPVWAKEDDDSEQ